MEIWEYVPDYEGIYQASTLGRIRSLDRYTNHRHGGKTFVKGMMLKQHISNSGYYRISLHKKCVEKQHSVHRLVLLTFIMNPKNKRTVNHKDGNKLNNKLENLEWATYSENELHAYRIGLKKSFVHIATEKTKRKVLMLSLSGESLLWFDSQKEANNMLGIDSRRISDCCRGIRKTAGGYKWEFYTN